tara:strand:- start:1122 stop:1598 length:477 start_codon:yes stop_codon:yes gene_type:complete
MKIRIGNGIDVHKLEKNIPLIIGGISIPFYKGSKGHSDGDVLFHSIVDAILGALSLGDIGTHFPSSDTKWKNAKSQLFLEFAYKMIIDKQYTIENIDSTIILQEPIINPYIESMKNNIQSLLLLNTEQISIKATTTDTLGFLGKGDGIAALTSIILTN